MAVLDEPATNDGGLNPPFGLRGTNCFDAVEELRIVGVCSIGSDLLMERPLAKHVPEK